MTATGKQCAASASQSVTPYGARRSVGTEINILLADDDRSNSLLLKRFLEAEGYRVTYAENGEEALSLYEKDRPHLILLDINMPKLDGFSVAKKIRETDRQTLIFFLTDRTEKTDRLHGFQLRGNDYIPKPFYPEELVMRIAERFAALPSSGQNDKPVTIGQTTFDPVMSTLTFADKTVSLSARQTQILSLLVAANGQPVPREEILQKVWGTDSYANSLALNVQITYLRRFLSPDSSLEIVSIKKRGYYLKKWTNRLLPPRCCRSGEEADEFDEKLMMSED